MQEIVDKAISYLNSAKPFVMPTETVYGLAVDAQNELAVQEVYKIKNRPKLNPLISHYADIEEIKKDVELDQRAIDIFSKLSPGPITLVLNKTKNSRISNLVSAGLNTAAVRIPDCEITLEILRKFKAPVAAPSANLSTELSPTQKEHVEKSLAGKVDFIIDAGKTKCGLESTILDLSSKKAVILRFGTITSQEIEAVINEEVYLKDDEGKLKAPGMMLKHYAPKTPLRMNAVEAGENEALIAFGEVDLKNGFKEVINISPSGDLAQAASNLFSVIHQLDDKAYDSIAVVTIPAIGIGLAINDRLKRATRV